MKSPEKLSTNPHCLLDVYGVIFDVKNNTICAHLYEHDGEYVEDVEFSIEEFNDKDKPLIKENAVFYWKVGYAKSNKNNQYSEFSMRRTKENAFLQASKLETETHKKYKKILGVK